MKRWVNHLLIITGALLLITVLLPAVTFAMPMETVDTLYAPFHSTVVLTYIGNPYPADGERLVVQDPEEIIDYQPPGIINEVTPVSQYVAQVGSVSSRGPNGADMGARYDLGNAGVGEEVIVNVSTSYSPREDVVDYERSTLYNYSTRQSWSIAESYIYVAEECYDAVTYNVSWFGYMYYNDRHLSPGSEEQSEGRRVFTDYAMQITFLRYSGDPLTNLTATRDFYTNYYPLMWQCPDFKVPCVLETDEHNVVVKAYVKSTWDPAAIGLTKQQAEDWVLGTYGVLPTYV